MNYCKNLRKRKNKPFCKILNKEIPFSRCWECDNKEYGTKKSKNSFCKSDIMISKKSDLNKKRPIISGKLKSKSNKLAKLERNRSSVFTDNKDKCMFCHATTNLTWHEIFAGRNRLNSMKCGFCLRMCLNCHEEKQENADFNDFWHRQAQLYFEENIGSREDFIKTFRRNYLD